MLEYYVLHYDTNTTNYLNEIVFKTYKDALEEFNAATPLNEFDRIELIHSPINGDNEILLKKED